MAKMRRLEPRRCDAPPPPEGPVEEGARVGAGGEGAGVREERALWRRWRESADPAARALIIERYQPFAKAIASAVFGRRGRSEVEYEDYLQFALVGLLQAVDRYDPDRGAQFKTYAGPRIRGAILTGLERNGDVVEMASYAPLLACDVTDQWVWKPDLIFFNNSEVKPSVNYQVQKLYGAHSRTEYWNTSVSAANQDPFVSQRIAASTVRDPQTGDIIIKLVNILPAPATLDAVIANATHVASEATLQLLTAGSLADREATLTESTVPAGTVTLFPSIVRVTSFAIKPSLSVDH